MRGWPKRHAHVVEECSALYLRDVLGHLGLVEQRTLIRWHPSLHPTVALVARQNGPVRRWWFRCRTCGACCEALFVPPNAIDDDWRCRRCCKLIYASQRYGRRHPLRRLLTPRKQASAVKAQERRRRAEAKAVREWEERRRLAAIKAEAKAELEAQQREQERARELRRHAAQGKMRALLEADLPDNLEFLRAISDGNLSPRSVEGRAARMLARAARAYGVGASESSR